MAAPKKSSEEQKARFQSWHMTWHWGRKVFKQSYKPSIKIQLNVIVMVLICSVTCHIWYQNRKAFDCWTRVVLFPGQLMLVDCGSWLLSLLFRAIASECFVVAIVAVADIEWTIAQYAQFILDSPSTRSSLPSQSPDQKLQTPKLPAAQISLKHVHELIHEEKMLSAWVFACQDWYIYLHLLDIYGICIGKYTFIIITECFWYCLNQCLGFWGWILEFWFWILDLGFWGWILEFWFCIVDLWFWGLDFGFVFVFDYHPPNY